jgi:long-subunit fatty acid transport protein
MEKLKLVVDLGSFTAADRSFDENTNFLTLGAIYSVSEDFDIDIGVKRGLTRPETDTTLLLGIALRF